MTSATENEIINYQVSFYGLNRFGCQSHELNNSIAKVPLWLGKVQQYFKISILFFNMNFYITFQFSQLEFKVLNLLACNATLQVRLVKIFQRVVPRRYFSYRNFIFTFLFLDIPIITLQPTSVFNSQITSFYLTILYTITHTNAHTQSKYTYYFVHPKTKQTKHLCYKKTTMVLSYTI